MTAAAVAVIVVLVAGVVLLAVAFRRSWPRVREQRDRLRRSGGPRGADVDTFVARSIERMPIDGSTERRPGKDNESSASEEKR